MFKAAVLMLLLLVGCTSPTESIPETACTVDTDPLGELCRDVEDG